MKLEEVKNFFRLFVLHESQISLKAASEDILYCCSGILLFIHIVIVMAYNCILCFMIYKP